MSAALGRPEVQTAIEVRLYADRTYLGAQRFKTRELIIGRLAPADLQLTDSKVSARHAVVHLTGRSCMIEDLSSRTGVWVRGKRISSHIIQPTDEIVIGRYTLMFVLGPQAGASGPREPDSIEIPIEPAQGGLESSELVLTLEEQTVVDLGATTKPTRPSSVERTRVESPRPIAPSRAPAFAPGRPARVPARSPFDRIDEQESTTRVKVQEPVAPPSAKKNATRLGYAVLDRPEAAPVPTLPEDLAPAPRAPLPDDDDDELFEVTFSLLERLRRQPSESRGDLVVEAIVYRGDFVEELRYLGPGEKLCLEGLRTPVCRHSRNRVLMLSTDAQACADVTENDGVVQDDGVAPAALMPGQTAVLTFARHKVHLRFVKRVDLPRLSRKKGLPDRQALIPAASSVALHLVALVVIAVGFSDRADALAEVNEGRFAKIDTRDLELEPPAPKPPEEKVKEPDPEPTPEPAPVVKPVRTATPTRRAPIIKRQRVAMATPGPVAPAPAQRSHETSKLLGALSALPTSTRSSAVASAATNLDAVTTSHSSGGYKVSGVIGKMPGDQLRLASGGSGVGRIDTKTATELTKGGKLGRLTATAGEGGHIRGVVAHPPARTVQVQGELDRGEIQKVVNAHLREVQGCYERKLIKDPSLSGKIIYEWVIAPSGQVGVVRVKFASVRDTEVSTCIQSSIKGWGFPQPRGGSVTVTYPFVFSTIGS